MGLLPEGAASVRCLTALVNPVDYTLTLTVTLISSYGTCCLVILSQDYRGVYYNCDLCAQLNERYGDLQHRIQAGCRAGRLAGAAAVLRCRPASTPLAGHAGRQLAGRLRPPC